MGTLSCGQSALNGLLVGMPAQHWVCYGVLTADLDVSGGHISRCQAQIYNGRGPDSAAIHV